jgi:hypothetical protein
MFHLPGEEHSLAIKISLWDIHQPRTRFAPTCHFGNCQEVAVAGIELGCIAGETFDRLSVCSEHLDMFHTLVLTLEKRRLKSVENTHDLSCPVCQKRLAAAASEFEASPVEKAAN